MSVFDDMAWVMVVRNPSFSGTYISPKYFNDRKHLTEWRQARCEEILGMYGPMMAIEICRKERARRFQNLLAQNDVDFVFATFDHLQDRGSFIVCHIEFQC